MDRFVKPQIVRLPISHGDFINVKKRHNQGERQDMMSRMMPYYVHGEKPRLESREVMTAKVLAYLVGWSLTDEGTPVPFSPDMPYDDRLSLLNNLDPDTFDEIRGAIDAHEEQVERESYERKNAPAGESESSPTSPSPEPSVGAMSGS